MKKNWCDIATLLYSNGLEFISGKWFFKGEEIKEIEKWLMHTDEIPYHDLITSDLEAIRCRDTFVTSYGTVGDWFELPIIAEAKAQKELKPLCLPLETKQLKIINRLLTPHQQKFFIITGVGGSGKSTFLNIIKQIFNNDFASLSLSDLGCDFKLATGINKRLICSDELAADDLNNAALKTIISGQEMPINPKFATPYKAKFQSSFIFCCNRPPRLNICDSGIMRRVVYYGMEKKITTPDLKLAYAEWSHEDLVNIVAHALALDMTDWEKDFEEETRYYITKYNSVYRFRDEDKYPFYSDACKLNGYKPFNLDNWEEIRDTLEEWGMLNV